MLSSQVLQLRHELINARAESDRQLAVLRRRLGRMDKNLAKLAHRPAVLLRSTGNNDTTTSNIPNVAPNPNTDEDTPMDTVEDVVRAPLIAKLGKKPSTLHDLWKEYVFGAGANMKPAKDFTRREKGVCSSTYCRRNVFWLKINEMIRMGYSADIR